MSRSKKLFYRCGICGKILIERRPNGLWYFLFGKRTRSEFRSEFRSEEEEDKEFVPVEMHIHGNVKMRCLRRSCRRSNEHYWNVFNFFPKSEDLIDDAVESLPAEINSKR